MNEPEQKELTLEEFYELRQTPAGKADPPIMQIPVSRWPEQYKSKVN